MINYLTSYSTSTPLQYGADITSADLNTRFNTVENWISSNSGYVRTEYSASSSVATNSVLNFGNTSAGAVQLTLPSAASVPPGTAYVFKKIANDGNKNDLTLQVAAGDSIENFRVHTITASLTNLVLQLPDQSVTLVARNNNEWRIVNFYTPNIVTFQAKMTSNQDITVATVTKVGFDATNYNWGAGFDTVNNRFEAPCDGIFAFTATISFEAGAIYDATHKIYFYRNGLEDLIASELKGPDVNKVERYTLAYEALLVKGDQIDVRVEGLDSDTRVKFEEKQTRFSGRLVQYAF